MKFSSEYRSMLEIAGKKDYNKLDCGLGGRLMFYLTRRKHNVRKHEKFEGVY